MPKRILLADDSITIQKVVELTFSDGDYEVTAVNNGARAIQKLGEMKPDIILSDIIMPEKNGYEVCEYVKSHPEYRTIPVVLLTGTFEPFDPDRAEKAGCDAVVTKPFESQSLIHKVEELIASTQSSASTTPPPAPEPEIVEPPPPPPPASAAAASPWLEEEPIADAPSPFTTSGGSFPAPGEAFTHGSDIFGAAGASESTTEMPFDTPSPTTASPSADATRAFPSLTAEDLQQSSAPSAEPSPWDEQLYGGETRAFEKMSVADLESMQQPLEPQHPAATSQQDSESPFGAPAAEEPFSAETRAFERMSFEELQQQAPSVEPSHEQDETMRVSGPSPWDEPADTPMFDGRTQAFPQMSVDQFPQHEGLPDLPEDAEEAEQPAAESSPWDEQPPAFAGETRAFEKMSFDDFPPAAPAPEQEPAEPSAFSQAPEPEAAPWGEPSEPAWSPAPEASEPEAQFTPESFGDAGFAPFPPMETEPEAQPAAMSEAEAEPMSAAPMPDFSAAAAPEDVPFASQSAAEPEPEEARPVSTVPPPPEEPAWSPVAAAEAAAEPEEPVVPPAALAPETPTLPIRSSELTDDQVDRIARRVIELMSDQVVRNIAWEVIPDLAEMVVKERIRQLESEA